MILDPEYRIIDVNREAIQAYGMAREDLLGRHCFEVFHGTDQPIPECPCPNAIALRRQVTSEVPGQDRIGLVSCTPVIEQDGRIRKVIHITRDITERRRAEDQLRESEALLRAVFDSTAVGINVHDAS